jgi:hypothetical protein
LILIAFPTRLQLQAFQPTASCPVAVLEWAECRDLHSVRISGLCVGRSSLPYPLTLQKSLSVYPCDDGNVSFTLSMSSSQGARFRVYTMRFGRKTCVQMPGTSTAPSLDSNFVARPNLLQGLVRTTKTGSRARRSTKSTIRLLFGRRRSISATYLNTMRTR